MRFVRSLLIGLGGLLLLIGLTYTWVPYLRHAPAVGVAHGAKKLCSVAFVSRLDPEQIWRDELRELLSVLGPMTTWEVDRQRGVARVQTPIAGATAVFRPGLGCTVLVRRSADQVRSETITPVTHPRMDPAVAWPAGAAGALTANPTDIDRDALDAAVDRAFAEPLTRRKTRQTSAVLVAHRGHLLIERHAPGFDPDKPLLGWSMSKTVTTLLAGRLIEMGKLAYDAPANLKALETAHDGREAITVNHLMRMTPGLEFEETYQPGDDCTEMLYEHSDQAAYAATRPRYAAPGQSWLYSTGTTSMLSRVVQNAAGSSLQAGHEFMHRELFHPLGITTAVVEPDEHGTFAGGSYFYMTARDWLRLGQLMANDGLWHGTQLLPADFVAYATTPTVPADNGDYGAGVWLNSPNAPPGRPRYYPTLPASMYLFQGHDGQYVAMIPEEDLVIARFGYTAEGHDSGFEPLVGAVIAAVQ